MADNGRGDAGDCVHCGLPVPRSAAASRFCCFGCRLVFELARSGRSDETSTPDTLLLRLGIGIFSTLNIMVFSWIFYSGELFGEAALGDFRYDALTSLFSYLLLLLTTLVLVTLGLPLLTSALRAFAERRLDTSLLVLLGVGAAYAVSALNTITGSGSLYYDTAALILMLVTLGNYLETGARQRAARLAGRLGALLPTLCWVSKGSRIEQLPTTELVPGDRVRVRPGEIVPADGQITEGSSHVRSEQLTGESRPRPVRPPERVLAGSANLDGQLWIEVTAASEQSQLAQTERLLASARLGTPPSQLLADRVAGVFVPIVVTLALTVAIVHSSRGEPLRGVFDALSVLLISCPCALGIAAPLATWMGLRRAAARGIFFASGESLENAAALQTVFFDKTGTLTDAELGVEGIEPEPGITASEALALAAGLESASPHPIANAFSVAARAAAVGIPPVNDAHVLPGLGVQGSIDGRRLWLGSEALARQRGLLDAAILESSSIRVVLTDSERILARFTLAESLRPDAAEAVSALRQQGLAVAVLTGDSAGPALRLASALSLEVRHSLMPAEKLRHLLNSARSGKTAMVGDGVNDAAVLKAADVGVAIGGASDLARLAGNLRLEGRELKRVPEAIAIARQTVSVLRGNLIWAFGYNAVGLTLAATGRLSPVFAATAMFASGLVIIANSRRAGRSAFDADRVSDATAERHEPRNRPSEVAT